MQIKFQVKWPNDILIKGKKIAGILCESGSRERLAEHIIVGIGINVIQDVTELSDEIQYKTTSLLAETSKQISREKLIAQILFTYEKNYINFQRTNYEQGIEHWKKRCDQFGKLLLIETPVSVEPGKFIDIDNKGVLIYQTRDGKIKKLIEDWQFYHSPKFSENSFASKISLNFQIPNKNYLSDLLNYINKYKPLFNK